MKSVWSVANDFRSNLGALEQELQKTKHEMEQQRHQIRAREQAHIKDLIKKDTDCALQL